ACQNVARAGHKLFRLVMQQDASERPDGAVRAERWLAELASRNYVESLEIAVTGKLSVPWGVLYEPDPDTFPTPFSPALDTAWWQGSWGLGFSLGPGGNVEPLRNMHAQAVPTVVIVLAEEVERDLPLVGTQIEEFRLRYSRECSRECRIAR